MNKTAGIKDIIEPMEAYSANNLSVAKKSLNDIVYEDLKKRILKGEITREQRLQEDNLARNSGLSRTPFRDALRRLEQENILIKLKYGGYQVKDLTLDEVSELFGIRSVLESYAALLAAQRVTKADIKKMESLIAKSKEASAKEDYEMFTDLNTQFHDYLYAASKSEHLLKILQNLRDYFYRYRKVILQTKTNLEDSIRDHEMMIQKMKEGEYETVERLVKDHINRALEALKKENKKKKVLT
ncbi:MAG: GntR family transcriptional regulator [Deltaproteobacteria bacterium]|nr:GntR family transcriptional regulator [Deltaproteobacteria bacterium]